MNLSPYILIGLRKNLEVYRLIAEAIPEARWDQPTGPNRFTIREAMAHWADWESVHLQRCETALSFDLAPVPNLSETDRAEEMGYRNWTKDHCIDLFERDRNRLISFVEERNDFEIRRRFVHAKFGTLTIADYAGHILGHDAYHIEQMLSAMFTK
ncbi:MAG: hypothetical protein HONBIEJF_01913 [Fimbriimonadaceae bacterium]|nr:hypothetical protein [Fimbriimonadaceae bacterium]